ncbi:MAG: hypothetical protein KatS3mg076_1588 [Candidatus Binatia bacterium]|nr:MAG: hypothetical protein KatS3mg076_1588 [Candidatus Binatia bacterium]
MPEGERFKVEFRGETERDSQVSGKVRGTDWILVDPLGAGQVESIQTFVSEEGDRFVVQVQGSSQSTEGEDFRIKAAGVIRARSPRFAHLDGHLAVVEEIVHRDEVELTVYHA